jgi:hypothetical protein
MVYVPTEQEKLGGIHHIVHVYANFASAGEMMETGKHSGVRLDDPVTTHVVHAFLLAARQMGEFFLNRPRKDDVVGKLGRTGV